MHVCDAQAGGGVDHGLQQLQLPRPVPLGRQLHRPLLLLLLYLVPPQPVLVEDREAVDHDGDGESEDEDTGQGAAAADDLAKQCLGLAE